MRWLEVTSRDTPLLCLIWEKKWFSISHTDRHDRVLPILIHVSEAFRDFLGVELEHDALLQLGSLDQVLECARIADRQKVTRSPESSAMLASGLNIEKD